MGFTKEQRKKIVEAVVAKRGQDAPPMTCPVCHTASWSVGVGAVRLVVQDDPGTLTLSGPSYPLIPMLCNNCGNTQFLNAFSLGIGEVLEISPGIPAKLPDAKKEGGNG